MNSIDVNRIFAEEIAETLRRGGFRALFAGGCVRDVLLGFTPSDYDVATDATPDQVKRLFKKTIEVGVSFGVVRVPGRGGANDVEIATFRGDGEYRDGRRPESVTFGTVEIDASRRDFTINGMYLDPASGEVLDLVGGRADLASKTLRAIGDPKARFEEDKLRLLRAARFAARLGFQIEPETRAAIGEMAGKVVVVAAERIAQELRKMLVHTSRAKGMNLAFELGLVAAIMPELIPMKGLFQGKPMQPAGDLWDHTILVMEKLSEPTSFPLAFAALYHDAGKPRAKGLLDGKTTFFQHEKFGRAIVDRRCRALKLSNDERERIDWLVEYHQYLGDPFHMKESTLKRMLATPGIDELLALHRADALASTGDASHVDYLDNYLRNEPAGPINPPPLLTGHDLARRGLIAGPHFKEILDQVRELQLERVLIAKRDAFEWIEKQLEAGRWPDAQKRPTGESNQEIGDNNILNN